MCAACGSVPSSPAHIDAEQTPDIDAPSGPLGDHRHYIVDHETIPATSADVLRLGLDLNGDGTVDNTFGNAIVTAGMFGFDILGANTAAVDHGSMLMLVDFQTRNLMTTTFAGVQTLPGTNPIPKACDNAGDTTCRHHLDGTGSFGVDPTVPRGDVLVGDVAEGVFTSAVGGSMTVWIAPFGDLLRFDLLGARIQLTGANDNGVTSGILAGGVTVTDINAKFLPSAANAMTPFIKRDCPNAVPGNCSCISGSTGATLISVYDADHNCVVSADELQNSGLIKSVLTPDLTIEGTKAVSFGIGISAVKAAFTP